MGSYSSRPFVFESIGSTTHNHWFAGKAENGNGILVVDSIEPTGSLLVVIIIHIIIMVQL